MANDKPVGVAFSDPALVAGWSLDGTAITPTAAQINKLASITTTATQLNQITDAFGTVTFNRGVKVARVALGVADTVGGVFAWANPEAGAVLVNRVIIDLTTVSTSACTLDIGVQNGAALTTSIVDDLLDGLDTNAATGTFDNVENQGTNGKSVGKVSVGKWVTASMKTGAAAGTAGFAYIHYTNI